MGGNQSQQQKKEKPKNRSRIRDFQLTMCFSGQPQQAPKQPKMQRALSDSMKSSNYDIFMYNSSLIIRRLHEEEMPLHQARLFQYLLTFLNVKDALSLRLINKKLKFIIEVSSNIYANQLSAQFMKKLSLPHFVEYGSDSRFQYLLSEQLLKVELNQDESWVRIYRKLTKCKNHMNKFQKKMEQNYHIHFNLSDKISNAIMEPMLPVPILTMDVLKHSTNSWFQLAMAHDKGYQTSIEAYNDLDKIIQELKQDCIGCFSSENLQHAQLLLELRWLIVDNYISDPSPLEGDVPVLLKFTLQIYHMIYLKCQFSRNVLMIMKFNKTPTQLLNFYIILWKSFQGTIWALNRLFEKLQQALEYVFNFFYKTKLPQFSFISALGRMWAQIVLKGAKKSEDIDPLEQDLLQGFQHLLREKRTKLLEFFTKDQNLQEEKYLSFKDNYFKTRNVAIDCLLTHFSSAALDVSIHEQSSHWIGHSQMKVGQFYGLLLENIIKDSHQIYEKASFLLQQKFDTFQEFILADNKYLEEIVNSWTVQICNFPIGLDYLYEKVKINIRQHTFLNLSQNETIFDQEIQEVNEDQQDSIKQQEPIYEQVEENQILESMILPHNMQFIQDQVNDEVQQRIERAEDPLFVIVSQIIGEEKLMAKAEQRQKSTNSKISVANKVISFIDNCGDQPSSKMRQLSKFSNSTRLSSQITCLTSQYSQQISSYRQQADSHLVRKVVNQIESSQWSSRLKDIQRIDIVNQIQIEKRDNQVSMRNFVKRIPQEIEENINNYLDFTNVQILEDAMLNFEKKDLSLEQLLEQAEPEPVFKEIQISGFCLATSIIQSE